MAILQRKNMARGSSRVESKSSRTRQGTTVVASAMNINLGDRGEAERLIRVKQPWQSEAWVYRRTLGELRYATAYMGNSCMRLRLYLGTNVAGQAVPVEITDNALEFGLPNDLVSAAQDALAELGNGGPTGSANMMKRLTENFQVAGEAYLVGRGNPTNAEIMWKIHSVSEVQIERDGRIGVREAPGGSAGAKDVDWLDLQNRDYVSRLWTPDPQWGMLADSPVRGILDICEELLLVGRDVRSTIRSRLANNGMLLVPDGLSIVGSNPESDDDEEDAFLASLMEAAEANIANEGEASAAVPLVVRGPADSLHEIKHLILDRPQNQFNVTQRAELISRMATGIDLPAEVLNGKVDLNHWTSWQVDDDTFRHHIEPTAITQVDALTTGYLWKRLDAMAMWPQDLVRKLVIWYDPTELVTHPDRTDDALKLWDRISISDDALRRVSGFVEDDAPTDEERLLRIALRIRSLDPSIQGQILKILDPAMKVPPPRDPGPSAGGPGAAPAPEAPSAAPGPPPGGAPGAAAVRAAEMRSRLMKARLEAATTAVTAAASPPAKSLRLGRQLLNIDQRLRERIHTAANTAIRRALERAGARIVSKARTASASPIRDAVKDVHPALVAGTLGRRMVASLGLTEESILDTTFTELKVQWDEWVAAGQTQALREVAKLAGVDMNAALAQLGGTFADNREEGWAWLRDAMTRSASKLFNDAAIDDNTEFEILTADLLSVGDVRASLALAGGFGDDPASSGLTDEGYPVDPQEMMGQVGTGDTISEFASANGFTTEGYEWIHGGSGNAFVPHLDLDGTQFTNFDDASHSTGGDGFPPGGYYYPGDHNGCSCDFMPIMVESAVEQSTAA